MKHWTLSIPVDQAVGLVQEAVAAFPMGLVAHINGQANAAKKGVTVPPDQILEVFRPDFAVRVWQAEKHAGIDIPLRIYFFEQQAQAQVLFRTPQEVFAPYANPALNAIAQELATIFDKLLAVLEPFHV